MLAQLLIDQLDHVTLNVGIELALRLSLELGLRKFHADHGGQTLAHVVAGEVFLHVLKQPGLLAKEVYGARQSAAEAAQVGAAVDGIDVVREAEHRFAVGIVVLERDLHGQDAAVRQLALAFEIDGLVVQDVLALIQMLDELGDAAVEKKLGGTGGFLALVGQGNLQALVQECQLAQPLGERVEVELGRVHDGRVGLERQLRSSLSRVAGARQRRFRNAASVLLFPGALLAPDLELQGLR